MNSNPFRIGVGGGAWLPARVCHDLELTVGKQLAEMRVRARGVDQDKAFALIAIRQAALGFVPVEEQMDAPRSEQAAPLEWLNTTEAAGVLETSPRGITQAISRGRLQAHKIDGRWRLSRTDLENYRKERQWHR